MDIPSYFWSKYMNHYNNATKYTPRPCVDRGCWPFHSFARPRSVHVHPDIFLTIACICDDDSSLNIVHVHALEPAMKGGPLLQSQCMHHWLRFIR
jgi:hypothetical protein